MEGNSRGIVKRVGTRPPSDFRLALLFINFLSSHVGITSGVSQINCVIQNEETLSDMFYMHSKLHVKGAFFRRHFAF